MSQETTAGLTVIGVAALAIVGILFAVYSGAYDVAATTEDSPLIKWAMSTTMDHSVKHHAADVKVPGGLDIRDPSLVSDGGEHYGEMCQMCHGGPGVKPSDEFVLNPKPPDLAKSAPEWSDAEIYWIVKHGIRMTGMPAFGKSHDDKQVWAITAFVRALPGMSPEDYQQLAGKHAGSHH